jgi:hypothetical protein
VVEWWATVYRSKGCLECFTLYLRNSLSLNLRAIENCICGFRSIYRKFRFILQTVCDNVQVVPWKSIFMVFSSFVPVRHKNSCKTVQYRPPGTNLSVLSSSHHGDEDTLFNKLFFQQPVFLSPTEDKGREFFPSLYVLYYYTFCIPFEVNVVSFFLNSSSSSSCALSIEY